MVVRMNSPSHLSLTRMTFTTEVEGNSTAALVSSVGAFFRSGKERKKIVPKSRKKEGRKDGRREGNGKLPLLEGTDLTKELGVGSVNTHKSCFGGRRQMKYVVASVGGLTTPHISIKYNTCVNARFLTIIYQTSAVLISVLM